jgi:hypothetical protein
VSALEAVLPDVVRIDSSCQRLREPIDLQK